MAGHNVVMPYGVARLNADRMVSEVMPDSRWRAGTLRCVAGVAVGIPVLMAFSWLDAWAVLPMAVAGLLVGWRADGGRLHDLLSELWSPRGLQLSVAVSKGSRMNVVRTPHVHAGAWVCLAKDFRAAMADYERLLEDRRKRTDDVNTDRQARYERDKRMMAGRKGPLRPPSRQYRGPAVRPPRIRFQKVIALRRSEHGQHYRVGIAGSGVDEWAEDEQVLIRSWGAGQPKPGKGAAGRALEDLITSLAGGSPATTERQVVERLLAANHPLPAVRHALRAAVALRIAERPTQIGRYLRQAGQALNHSPASKWNGGIWPLTLTALGQLWMDAGNPEPAGGPPPRRHESVTINLNATFITGDNNQVFQNITTPVERDIVALRQLLAVVDTGQATHSEQLADALRTIREAVATRRPRTPATRNAVRVILKFTGEVLAGVVGNVIFMQLLDIASQ